MSKPIVFEFKVVIENLKVDTKYYSFDYEVWVNGILKKEELYSNDHSWGNDYKKFRRILRNSYAAQIVCERIELTEQGD